MEQLMCEHVNMLQLVHAMHATLTDVSAKVSLSLLSASPASRSSRNSTYRSADFEWVPGGQGGHHDGHGKAKAHDAASADAAGADAEHDAHGAKDAAGGGDKHDADGDKHDADGTEGALSHSATESPTSETTKLCRRCKVARGC